MVKKEQLIPDDLDITEASIKEYAVVGNNPEDENIPITNATEE